LPRSLCKARTQGHSGTHFAVSMALRAKSDHLRQRCGLATHVSSA